MCILRLAVVVLAAVVAVGAASAALPKYPVSKLQAAGFGAVLASSNRQALYYWSKEQRGGPIKCSGACAKAWPPLLLPKGVMAKHKLSGFKGTFGEIRRPDGRMQLTYNGRALYSYAHEGPGKVLCDGVDGWFVLRL